MCYLTTGKLRMNLTGFRIKPSKIKQKVKKKMQKDPDVTGELELDLSGGLK